MRIDPGKSILEERLMDEQNRQPTGAETPIEQNNDTTSTPESTSTYTSGDPTLFERAADNAREGATAAADSLRRGEIMQNAAIDPAASSDDRLIAFLSYASQVFIPLLMPIIVLISESSKKRPFQRYHAVQSLALSLTFFALFVASSVSAVVLQIIPVIGTLIGLALFCLMPIAYLMGVVAMIYYGFQAYKGKRFAIPGLTTFLQDQDWL
jgi:uncharacterized membrane protein